jgi:hypothetical protein
MIGRACRTSTSPCDENGEDAAAWPQIGRLSTWPGIGPEAPEMTKLSLTSLTANAPIIMAIQPFASSKTGCCADLLFHQ